MPLKSYPLMFSGMATNLMNGLRKNKTWSNNQDEGKNKYFICSFQVDKTFFFAA